MALFFHSTVAFLVFPQERMHDILHPSKENAAIKKKILLRQVQFDHWQLLLISTSTGKMLLIRPDYTLPWEHPPIGRTWVEEEARDWHICASQYFPVTSNGCYQISYSIRTHQWHDELHEWKDGKWREELWWTWRPHPLLLHLLQRRVTQTFVMRASTYH